jgi:hypothetical protein
VLSNCPGIFQAAIGRKLVLQALELAAFQNQVVLECAGRAPPVLENQSFVLTVASRFLEEAFVFPSHVGMPQISP